VGEGAVTSRKRYGISAMSYMLLIIQRPEEFDGIAVDEGRQRYDRMMAFGQGLSEQGLLVAGESLGMGKTGMRIRKRGGKQTTIDGPFAEAKEFVGGFFLLSCETFEQAAAIGAKCPAAEWSTVEVRAIGTCFEDMI
jgi:hypothetical protein